jgi:hypothetical protein
MRGNNSVRARKHFSYCEAAHPHRLEGILPVGQEIPSSARPSTSALKRLKPLVSLVTRVFHGGKAAGA